MSKTLHEYYLSLPQQTSPKSDFVREIVNLCGVSFTTAMNWVGGKNRPLCKEHLYTLSKLTGIDVKDLFQSKNRK